MSTTTARQARLPIWRDANRLLVEIERAVRRFPRYHKYALGTDLRRLHLPEQGKDVSGTTQGASS